jgi:hypothetical protein
MVPFVSLAPANCWLPSRFRIRSKLHFDRVANKDASRSTQACGEEGFKSDVE